MRIIVDIQDIMRGIKDPDELKQALFDFAGSLYEMTFRSSETYISNDFECVLGSENPDEIVNAAKAWNKEIQDAFTVAYLELVEFSDYNVCGQWKIDNLHTYKLHKAACELDGAVCENGEHGVCIKENFLRSYLLESEIKDIEANPAGFAMLTMYIK